MQPTVLDVVGLPVVQAGAPEVVGTAPLDRPVRWVHVADVPDMSNLLQGGELVLTTGQALTDDAVGVRYLQGLAEAGAAGLFVELGRYIDAVSPQLADAADRVGLPVVALHRQIKFVELTEAVHRSIVADQYDEVSYARHVHETFTDLSMKRASLREIVDATSALLGSPIVLEDLNRQVLAFAARGIPASALIGDWERRSRLTPLSNETTVGGPESWLCSPVGPPRNAWGRLVAPGDVAFPERARMTLERAAQALVLHRMIEQDRTALELRAQSGLIDDLRRGRVTDEAEATARAHALGLRPALTYLPLTVQVTETFSADQVFAQRRRTLMLDAVRHAVQSTRYTALTTVGSPGRIDLLVSQPGVSSPEALADVCRAIRDSLTRLDGVSRCTIGVGPESTRLIDAAADLIESAHIADVALALPVSDKVFHRAADIRLRGLLALIRTDPRVQAFAEAELRGLLEHRARHGDDTYDVLRKFLEFGGNKSELAKHLHMSRPTLYAKLAMIEGLLGVDLDDAESRTSLHTAVLILDAAPL